MYLVCIWLLVIVTFFPFLPLPPFPPLPSLPSPPLLPLPSLHPQAKHLQYVSGVSPTSYWLSSYAWDLINSLLPVVLSVILFAAFQVEAYSGDALGAIFVILVRELL